jgi:hypothetical protein
MLESRPEWPAFTGSEGQSAMRHQIAVLMLFSLMISTTFVLLLFRQALEPIDTVGAPAPGLGVVRSYVSDLNAFLQGGEPDRLMKNYDANASVRTGDARETIDTDTLQTNLLAIRSSYPTLTLSLGDVHKEGDAIIAEFVLNMPGLQTPEWIGMTPGEASTRLIETFRTEGGLIVEHRSSLLGLPAVHLLDSPPAEMRLMRRSTLTIARMTFPARETTFVPVPGPAMVIVREGSLEVAGGAADFYAPSTAQPLQALTIGTPVQAGRGAILVSTVAGIAVRNAGPLSARIDVVAMPAIDLGTVAGPLEMSRMETAGNALPLETRLTDAFLRLPLPELAVRIDDVSVTPVARSTKPIPLGTGTLLVAVVFLPAGASVSLDERGGPVTFAPLDDASIGQLDASQRDGSEIIDNTGSDPIHLLVARYAA